MDDNSNYPYGYDWNEREPEQGSPPPEPDAASAPDQAQYQPAYSYQDGGQGARYAQQQAPYYPPPQPPVQPQEGKKKKKSGAVIFSVFIVLAIVIGVFVGLGVYRSMNPSVDGGNNPGSSQGTVNDDTRMELNETPTKNLSAEAGALLTSEQVYDKLKDSNVAVQLYSSRNSDSVVGEGSGIILHEDSTKTYTYVVTCAHVIDGDERVSVELLDGTTYDATIVGYDSRTDIGLLRIKATGLTAAEFGDSGAVQVGETAYAIGNPGGVEFKGSFTNGIVSAIDRSITSTYKMQTIQHTAPISPGNSGGALVNSYGQVIGINSQKIVDADYENMGFAIPSAVVQEVVNNLIEKGYVPDRPKLGIQYVAASQTQKGYYVVRINNLPSGSLIIAKIDEGSDISGTDVRANDIITHVNGKPLNKSDVLLSAVESGKVGDKLKLTIARVDSNYNIETFDVEVKLVEDKGSSTTTEETQPWYYDDYGSGW